MRVRVRTAPGFEKALKSLPPDRGKAVMSALVKFAEEPSLPSLKFRSLESKSGYFIINPTRGDRIILRKDADDLYTVVDVGPHDNVYRRWNRR
jgi:hypothetical protein